MSGSRGTIDLLRAVGLAAAMLPLAVLCSGCGKTPSPEGAGRGTEPVTIKVGHVGHDHHLALFVAADNAEQYGKEAGIALNTVEDRKRYVLTDRGRKVADIEIVRVGGGSKMPTALAQGVIEVGLGGVAPVLAVRSKHKSKAESRIVWLPGPWLDHHAKSRNPDLDVRVFAADEGVPSQRNMSTMLVIS